MKRINEYHQSFDILLKLIICYDINLSISVYRREITGYNMRHEILEHETFFYD